MRRASLRRGLAAAVLSGSVVVAGAAPALADDGAVDATAPTIVSTGIVDGQFAPAVFLFKATVTDDVRVSSVLVLIHKNIQGALSRHDLSGQVHQVEFGSPGKESECLVRSEVSRRSSGERL